MSHTYTALSFLRHLRKSSSWTRIHSPYLFSLFSFCCDERQTWPEFLAFESKRRQLLRSNKILIRKDFGAGSIGIKGKKQTVGSIAANAASLPYQCRFMTRLAFHIQPENILELGTSLGISTLYLALASHITTVEGDPAVAEEAKCNFSALKMEQITSVVSTFDEYFKNKISSNTQFKLVFIDGDHRSDALITCFKHLKPHLTSESIVVIDDLYWSADMTHGWHNLIELPEVTQSVNCFHFGLIFFNRDFMDKKHHKIRLPIRSLFK